tara:strand:+ start:10564 stop:11370 length:807 start_codon:yes stop_codon:yes gene_type:complete
MNEIYRLFEESKNFSTKYSKYFKIYEELFTSYKDRPITFVEIGVYNGGSLEIWKKFFNKESRIIGIDINPECKKLEEQGFEIFIGDQSKANFWEDFFKKVGKVDIILDDGGHKNDQQIITLVNCIKNINNGGLLAVEDTHTSYLKEFTNSEKYSFINFSKKLIDDINYTYPNLGNFKFSLNKYIYSMVFYESFVVFRINTERAKENTLVGNNSDEKSIKMLDTSLTERNKIEEKFKILFKFKPFRKILRIIHNLKRNQKNKNLRNFFK